MADPSSVPGAAARVESVVDLAAVRQNVRVLAAAAPGAALMAVVKADGYGHGAVPVARAALDAGATWLGVCTLDEALALRGAGIAAPVLSWLHLPDEDFAPAVAAGIDLSAASRAHLAAVLDGARRAGRPARVHLKVDTGLSRNGAALADWPDLLDDAAKAAAEGACEVVAVWSHLAHADIPDHPMLDVQAARLTAAWRAAVDRGLAPIRHLANSAATLTRRDLHFDLVRPGIAVYGLDPLERPVGQTPLRPAMTLAARVVLVKRVPAGEGVSYGHDWTAETDTTLALVPIGYADGVPRRLNFGGRMRVLLGGRLRPVVGRVCMDQVVVDCGPAGGEDEVAVGDGAVLFGPGNGRRADRAGLGGRARHDPLRGRHRGARQPGAAHGGRHRFRRRGPGMTHRRAWQAVGVAGGLAGAAATGAAVSVAARKRHRDALDRHTLATQLSTGADGTGALPAGVASSVTADDGVRLSCEEIEPPPSVPADVTVVLVHGFALDRRTWHFQRPLPGRPRRPPVLRHGALRPAQPRPLRAGAARELHDRPARRRPRRRDPRARAGRARWCSSATRWAG